MQPAVDPGLRTYRKKLFREGREVVAKVDAKEPVFTERGFDAGACAEESFHLAPVGKRREIA